MTSKGGKAPADSARSAFQESQYATPYTDHTIPGDHPVALPLQHRLGRDHAPNPITASHLYHTLEVAPRPAPAAPPRQPPAGGASDAIEPAYACDYILNSKHEGRRHYAEQRGDEQSTDVIGTRKGYAPPAPRPQASDAHGRGRGKGACHADNRTAADLAALRAATERRELELIGGRRGYAPGPSDHSHIELGLWHLSGRPAGAEAEASGSARATASSADVLVVDESAVEAPQQQQGGAAAAAARGASAINPIVHGGAGGGTGGGLPPYVASVRPEMGDIGYGSVYDQRGDFKYSAQARRDQREQREMREEVKAVKDLPNW